MRSLGGRPGGAGGAAPRIDVYTNAVAGGWRPEDLETGLGGSEEVIVLWARALARRGVRVTVYYSPPPGHAERGNAVERGDAAGVRYRPRGVFDPLGERDVLVTWKDARPWLLGAQAARRIHWSSDVEPPWPPGLAERLHAWVALTDYHAARVPWVPRDRLRVVPHGIDCAALDAGRCERVAGQALYASSPDRGLERLLLDWPRLRVNHPALELHVTYGWRQFDACAGAAPGTQRNSARFRSRVAALLRQPGVVLHGALSRADMARAYWRAQYWVLPLEVPDAELFCLNALKARRCGATPVIHRRGALENTVDTWHPYSRFVATPAAALGAPLRATNGAVPILDWNDVVDRYWIPLLQGGT
jgi:hypothetical protein